MFNNKSSISTLKPTEMSTNRHTKTAANLFRKFPTNFLNHKNVFRALTVKFMAFKNPFMCLPQTHSGYKIRSRYKVNRSFSNKNHVNCRLNFKRIETIGPRPQPVRSNFNLGTILPPRTINNRSQGIPAALSILGTPSRSERKGYQFLFDGRANINPLHRNHKEITQWKFM